MLKTLRYIQYLLIRLIVGKRPVMMNIDGKWQVQLMCPNTIFIGNINRR